MKRVIGFLGLAAVVFSLSLPTAFAAEFISGNEDNGNVTLSAGETHRNVYTAGGTVFVNSAIGGDIYAAGGTITIESGIEQDAVIAGGTVTINGEIGGDLRVAGGTVTINNRVGGDLLIGGGNVVLTEKGSVGGDLAVASGNLTVDGAVGGNAKIAGETVVLNSVINGRVDVRTGQSLTFGNKAVISQSISHKGPNEATVNDGAQIGTVDYKKEEMGSRNQGRNFFAAIFTLSFIVKSIGLILAGLLLMKLFPRTSRESIEYMQRGPWMNLLIGFLTLVVGPIVVVILLITFIGMYIAIAAFLAWLLMLLLAALVASVFVGAWIIKFLTKKQEMRYDWQALVIGVVVLAILMLVPIIGALGFFILMLIAYGGLIRQLYDRMQSEQSLTNQTNGTI
jgi:hypothetical protein